VTTFCLKYLLAEMDADFCKAGVKYKIMDNLLAFFYLLTTLSVAKPLLLIICRFSVKLATFNKIRRYFTYVLFFNLIKKFSNGSHARAKKNVP